MRDLIELYSLYQENVSQDVQKSIIELINDELLNHRDINSMGFEDDTFNIEVDDVIDGILHSFLDGEKINVERNNIMDEENILFELGLEFIAAVDKPDHKTMQKYVDNDYPVNFQHPRTLQTALHVSAYRHDIKGIEILLSTGQCNTLIQDRMCKIPFINACLHPGEEVHSLIYEATLKDATNMKINLPEFIGRCNGKYWDILNGVQ